MMGAGNTRGIGRYTEELIRAMVQIAPQHRYVLAMRQPDTSPFQGNPSVEHVSADVAWYGLGEQIYMPGILSATKPDIVHVPHWNVPVFSALRRVVTIHDLLLLSEPASAKTSTRDPITKAIKRLGHRLVLTSALTSSRQVLVPTEWVAADIKKHFPELRTPIQVTGEGMPEGLSAFWQDADPSDPYLLYVGSAYPHKNLDQLLEAWKQLAATHPQLTLKLVGERDVFMKRLEDCVQQEKVPRVVFTGRVTDEALTDLYAKALALVFPSRNEGFGLPPLEALAHGIPVVAARSSCLPEVLGEASAVFFEPGSQNDILRAIETVLRDPVGAREKARLSVPALERNHRWQHAAERTLQAYEQAVR